MAGEKFVKPAATRRDGKMRNYLIFPVLLLTAVVVSSVSAQVPKIHYDREIGRPEIKATGKLEKVMTPGAINNANTPPGMLAYAVAENNCIFNWEPSVDTGRITSQADIIDALLSPDESLLIIAERIGGANQNNSTRLLFVNLINSKLCGSMDIPERRIVKLLDLPGQNGTFLALQEGQSAFQNGNALLKIDIRRKRVRQIGQDINEQITGICTDGNSVWFSALNSTRICELELDNPFKLRHYDTKKPVMMLGYNPSSKSVIAVEDGYCEFFNVVPSGLFLDNSVELPANYKAAWFMCISSRSNSALTVDGDGKALFISPGGLMPLTGRFAPYGCTLPDGTVLMGTVERLPRVNNIILPGGDVKGYIVPASLRPLNRNRTFAIFASTAKVPEFIQLDERGNVFKLSMSSRRGRKSSILIVNKTGFR